MPHQGSVCTDLSLGHGLVCLTELICLPHAECPVLSQVSVQIYAWMCMCVPPQGSQVSRATRAGHVPVSAVRASSVTTLQARACVCQHAAGRAPRASTCSHAAWPQPRVCRSGLCVCPYAGDSFMPQDTKCVCTLLHMCWLSLACVPQRQSQVPQSCVLRGQSVCLTL